MRVIFDEDNLERCRRFWQDMLNLREWNIKQHIDRRRAFDNPAKAGEAEVVWNAENAQAYIRVMDPNDIDRNDIFPQDMEQGMLHELLHLHLIPFDTEEDSMRNILKERTINLIADALILLRRRNGWDDGFAPEREEDE